MSRSHPEQRAQHARAALVVAAAALFSAALAPTLVENLGEGTGAAVVRAAFAPLCHQIPERSFALAGRTIAVCQRCSGIYAGLLFGAFAAWLAIMPSLATARVRRRRIAIAACTLPMLVDVALEVAGVRQGTPLVRAATGAVLGFMLSTIVSEGLAELAREGVRAAEPWIDRARLRP